MILQFVFCHYNATRNTRKTKHTGTNKKTVVFVPPECVRVASRVEAAGVRVVLTAADVVLHDVAGGALLDVHAFVSVRGDVVALHEVVVAAVRSVHPLPTPRKTTKNNEISKN